jgi:hypothetical protein
LNGRTKRLSDLRIRVAGAGDQNMYSVTKVLTRILVLRRVGFMTQATRMYIIWLGILLLPSSLFGQIQSGDYYYESVGDGIRIVKYVGADSVVTIPDQIDGLPVRIVGASAFINSTSSQVVLPSGITNIEDKAFASCSKLSAVNLPAGAEVHWSASVFLLFGAEFGDAARVSGSHW